MRFWWLCTDELHWPVICTVIKGLSSSPRREHKSHLQRRLARICEAPRPAFTPSELLPVSPRLFGMITTFAAAVLLSFDQSISLETVSCGNNRRQTTSLTPVFLCPSFSRVFSPLPHEATRQEWSQCLHACDQMTSGDLGG